VAVEVLRRVSAGEGDDSCHIDSRVSHLLLIIDFDGRTILHYAIASVAAVAARRTGWGWRMRAYQLYLIASSGYGPTSTRSSAHTFLRRRHLGTQRCRQADRALHYGIEIGAVVDARQFSRYAPSVAIAQSAGSTAVAALIMPTE
jgi:hypothetical protein